MASSRLRPATEGSTPSKSFPALRNHTQPRSIRFRAASCGLCRRLCLTSGHVLRLLARAFSGLASSLYPSFPLRKAPTGTPFTQMAGRPLLRSFYRWRKVKSPDSVTVLSSRRTRTHAFYSLPDFLLKKGRWVWLFMLPKNKAIIKFQERLGFWKVKRLCPEEWSANKGKSGGLLLSPQAPPEETGSFPSPHPHLLFIWS